MSRAFENQASPPTRSDQAEYGNFLGVPARANLGGSSGFAGPEIQKCGDKDHVQMKPENPIGDQVSGSKHTGGAQCGCAACTGG